MSKNEGFGLKKTFKSLKLIFKNTHSDLKATTKVKVDFLLNLASENTNSIELVYVNQIRLNSTIEIDVCNSIF